MKTPLSAFALALLVATAPVRAGEESIPLDKLPKAVATAVKKRFPKAEWVEAAKETDGTKVEYEVSIKDGDSKIDVMLTPEGAITLIEKQIAVTALPKAVADAIAAKFPKGKVTLAEEMTKVADGKETLDYYEVLVETADKKKMEAEVAPDGTVKKTEDKGEGEKKD